MNGAPTASLGVHQDPKHKMSRNSSGTQNNQNGDVRRKGRRFLSCCVIAFVAFLLLLYAFSIHPHLYGKLEIFSFLSCSGNEVLEPKYDDLLAKEISAQIRMHQENLDKLHPFNKPRRGQHAKSLACLRATFDVSETIPAHLKKGIFANATSYKAWVRFSPGQSSLESDEASHARGMAIKLANVPGEKLMDDESSTQDFLLLNSPIFFAKDNNDYKAIINSRTSFFHVHLMSLIYYVTNYLSWNNNPLAHSFFSTTPYKLGSSAIVKYKAEPCHMNFQIEDYVVKGTSQMRSYLRETLNPDRGHDLCYKFYVQERQNKCTQPIEDPTVVWNSPFIHVATLKIPAQDFMFEDQFEFCDALAFNPWHSLPSHQPLGEVNYVRKLVYSESLKYRKADMVTLPEITGDESFVKPIHSVNFDIDGFDKSSAGNTQMYSYTPYWFGDLDLTAIPPFVTLLPPEERFDIMKYMFLVIRRLISLYEQAIQMQFKTHLFQDPQNYELFHTATFQSARPTLMDDNKWRRDDEWAAQHIRGVDPTRLHRTWALPPGLDLDEDRRQKLDCVISRLRPNDTDKSLEKLLSTGNLFYVETASVLRGVHRVFDGVLYEPIILFTTTSGTEPAERKLMPIAIQMNDTEAFDDMFFLPDKDCSLKSHHKDPECILWMFVKMHAASATGNIHQALTHLGLTHLVMEPFVLASNRQFAPDHPIFKLLKPHFYQTLAINDEGRNTLLMPEGSFEMICAIGLKGTLQIINRGFEKLNLSEFSYPKRMEKLGWSRLAPNEALTEKDPLPGYLYRDYAWWIWDGLFKYCSSVVNKVYPTNEHLSQDKQLQRWARELSDKRYASLNSFPTSIQDKSVLIDLLTSVIFTATVQHSAANFGQFNDYGFIPNRPLIITKPIPANPSEITMQYVMEALPDKDRAFTQMGISYALSAAATETGNNIEVDSLLETECKQSAYPEEFKAFLKSCRRLGHIMKSINELYDWHYPYLYPDTLATSISI